MSEEKEVKLPCKFCGKEMVDDFFIIRIDRIKNSCELFFADPLYLCKDCYESLNTINKY